MGLWLALGPIATSFLVPHGVAMVRTTLAGQRAQVLGPGVRVAFVFPPWLSNTFRAAMSPSSGGWCCRTRGGNWRKLPGTQELCLGLPHMGLDPGLSNSGLLA